MVKKDVLTLNVQALNVIQTQKNLIVIKKIIGVFQLCVQEIVVKKNYQIVHKMKYKKKFVFQIIFNVKKMKKGNAKNVMKVKIVLIKNVYPLIQIVDFAWMKKIVKIVKKDNVKL